MSLISPRKVALVLALSVSMSLLGSRLAAAADLDACTLMPQAAVAKIVGNDAPIARHSAPIARDGVTSSSCVFQQLGGSGNTGFITVSSFESKGAAQARLAAYGQKITAAGGKVEPETVGGLPASYVVSAGGTGQMFVIDDNVMLGAGVSTQRKGVATSLPDRSRELVTAALAQL